jgi:2-keto-4-pentenoate hydratase
VTGEERRAAATALAEARRERAAIAPPSESWPGMDLDDAYAVQSLLIAERVGAGEAVVGWKVGLTSLAMQRQLGVDEPDFGPLLDAMEVADGGELERAALISPRVEAELAFRLGAHLTGPGVGVEEAAAATVAVLPALEIIDSRIADWKLTLPDTVADHASSAGFVLGGSSLPLDEVDRGAVELELAVDGDPRERGAGAAVLGDPLLAVAWLVNTLANYGEGLRAGQVVLAGALHAAVPAQAGSRFEARASEAGLGSVSVSFR